MNPRDEFRAQIARLDPHEAALMLTDIVGYTKLIEKEPKRALDLLDEHNAIVQECVEKHGGIVAKVLGDAYLVEFFDAVEAARCAFDIQVRLAARNLSQPEEKRINVRVGLHFARVIPREQELTGKGMKVLSRIEPRAPVGGVCLTKDVFDRIHETLPARYQNLGPQDLEAIVDPVHLYVVPAAGFAGPEQPATQIRLVKDHSVLLPALSTPVPVESPAVDRTPERALEPEPVSERARAPRWRRRSRMPAAVAGLVVAGGAVFAAWRALAPGGIPESATPTSPPAAPPAAKLSEPVRTEAAAPAPAARAEPAVKSTPAPERAKPAPPPAREPPPKPAPPAARAEKTPAPQPVASARGTFEEKSNRTRREQVLRRLRRALAKVGKLPRAQQRKLLPDLEDWRKDERRLARGVPVDLDHLDRYLRQLERALARL